MLCKILVDYHPAEGWKVGDIVEISNADKLIVEGKVEAYKEFKVSGEIVEPAVSDEKPKKKGKVK